MRSGVELADAQALRRSRRDPEAICILYDRYLPRLVAVLARLGGDREAAFDIAQETFARALEHGHRVQLPADGSAWPWLATIGRNLLRDRQRRERVDATARQRLRIAPASYDEEAVDALISRVTPTELAEALDSLPIPQRTAVLGRVALERSYEAIAAEVGTTPQVVRARVSRGLRALRIRLAGGKP